MLEIRKIEPDFFTDKKKRVPSPKQSNSWSKISDIRNDLKKYMLQNEQSNMCVYCEKVIKDDSPNSLIDHFKVRNYFPDLTLEYTNIFVDCGNKSHCSYVKDNIGLKKEEFEKLISPLHNIKENFSYTMFGELEPLNDNANFTKDCFDLNCISLIEERKKIINNFKYYKELDDEIILDYVGGHINLIKYLKENIYIMSLEKQIT